MPSEIIKTLKKYLRGKERRAITDSATFVKVEEDFEYFERYVSDPNVPNLVGMINDMIVKQAESIPNSQLAINQIKNGQPILAISENGKLSGPIVRAGYIGPVALGVKCETYGVRGLSDPTVYINKVGHNHDNWRELSKYGVSIAGHNIPEDIAYIVLKDFKPVKLDDRNTVMLKLAELKEIIECHPPGYCVNFEKKQIRSSGATLVGINENSVHIIENPDNYVQTYGNCYNYHTTKSFSMNLRVKRTGIEYKIPSRRE